MANEDIDPVAFEQQVLKRQQPMNNVIDLGTSPIQQYYDGVTVFITGGSGFIGKHLVEKLFRACNIKKLYFLCRSKKGMTIQERLAKTLTNPVFDLLRQKKPNFADRIVPIEGDVEELKLGLSDKDRATLIKEVNIIFHGAATVRFDEPLRKAVRINIRGTRELLEIAKECKQLKKFVHISTAYTHATKDHINKDVLEQFYPCPLSPDVMLRMAEEVDESRLDSITMDLIEGWPNTYTFTKAITEELIRTYTDELPVCIVRPPIVIPSYIEPAPGWLDHNAVAGPSGIYLTVGLGILNVFCVDVDVHLAFTPIDYVNNAIIASAWDSTERAKTGAKDIPIYTIAKKEKYFRWQFIGDQMRKKVIRMSTPKSVWRCEMIEVKNRMLYTFLSWFVHYIPAFILDVICTVIGKKPKEVTSFVDVYRKIDKLGAVYVYFLKNEWYFKDHNVQAMISRMNNNDRLIFNSDMMTLDLEEYVLVWALGLRKYIVKDGLTGTKAANRKQVILKYVNYIVVVLYLYVLWLVFSSVATFLYNIVF